MALDKHALENFSVRWGNFVDGLALSEEPLRDRLAAEYTMTLLPVIDGTIRHLPEPHADRLADVHARLHSSSGARGAVAESLNRVDDEEVRDVLTKLLDVSHVVGAYALRLDES